MVAGPRGVVLLLYLGLLLAIVLTMIPRPSWSADDLEQGLKVAYLYNFTRFIEWPEATLGEDFVVTVIGDPALAAALQELEGSDRRAHGSPIRVRAVDDVGEIGDCQILFVGAAAVSRLPRLLARTDGRPILLVGDSRGLARRGIAINFFMKSDIFGAGRRLRFEINPAALKDRGLKVSAQLYDVAEIVR